MRLKIVLSTITVIFVVGVIVFFFQRFQKVMENQIAEQVANSQVLLAKTGGDQVSQIFNMAKQVLVSAANSFPLQNLLAAIEKKDDERIKIWKSALSSLLYDTLESHRFLNQLRFIDSNGDEIIRVDRKKDGNIYPVKNLQNKSEEFYFSKAMSMESKEIYLSPITLNREFGKIEVPHREMIRLATSVNYNKQKKGIVVSNIEMNTIYSIVDNLSEHSWLFDRSGKLLECSLGLPQEYHDKAIKTILQQNEDSSFLPLDYYHESGDRSIVGYNKVNVIAHVWYVGSELPFGEIVEIMAKSNKMRIILFVIIAVSFIVVLIYFYKLYSDRQKAEIKAEMADGLFKLNKQLEKKSSELETANHSLEEIDKRKTDFLNMVAHDIRTPLTAIRSYSELLLRYGNRSEKDREGYADIIKKESVRLSNLVDDFLDISKIEAGVIDYNRQELDIKEVIDHFVTLFQIEGKAHKITITCEMENDLPHINGDKNRLGQVFSNLLSNAIKFTPAKGSINIKATSVKIAENGIAVPYIQIAISDTGIGIPEESLDKIFEKFVQVTHRDIKATRGTGLGLTITKEIVEHHGGKIEVESKVDKGTTITFTLKVLEKQLTVKS